MGDIVIMGRDPRIKGIAKALDALVNAAPAAGQAARSLHQDLMQDPEYAKAAEGHEGRIQA
ncbi:unnamed protein product, partial [marine sediment metagenome]